MGVSKNNDDREQAEYTTSAESVPNTILIGDEVNLFIKQIDSLDETLPLTLLAIKVGYEAAYKAYREFVDNYCEIESGPEGESVKVPSDFSGRYKRLESRMENALLASEAVPRSFIVSLISSYDAFLGGLIRDLFFVKPDILSASERNITFSDLVGFGSVEEARRYIVEKEVETVLRKSHSEQFDWLENKFGLPLRKDLEIWPNFIEVTERRNLFVHNRGIVSNHYLDVCRKHGVEFDVEPQIGEQLSVPTDYFISAFETIFEMGVKLAHVLWRKVQPQDLEKADSNLIAVGYDLLSEERFALARRVLDFSTTTLKRFASDQNRLMLVVNQAQAYKWSDDMDTVRSILANEDWSTRSDDFRLAEAVLLDDLDKANDIVRRVGTTGNVKKSHYREWPLFRAYRESEAFQLVFEEVFQEPVNIFSVRSQEAENSLSESAPDNNPFFEDTLLLEDEQYLGDEMPPLQEA